MNSASQASRTVVLPCCPLCGSTSSQTLVDADYEWVRCSCMAVYKRSAPAAVAGLGAAYHEETYDEAYFERYSRRRRHRIGKARRQIRDALDVAPSGRLLDVGCSLGTTLEAARSLGLEACGADVSEHAVDACRRLGFDARRGSLEALPFEDASFAVVVLKHVFEHTPAPRDALAELRRVLVPGAAAFFAVPNLEYFKAARSPETSRFFRGEAARAHFVYYSPETLSQLLGDEGFRAVSVHPKLVHSSASPALRVAELAAVPARMPYRVAAEMFGLRKEFWLVAVRE